MSIERFEQYIAEYTVEPFEEIFHLNYDGRSYFLRSLRNNYRKVLRGFFEKEPDEIY